MIYDIGINSCRICLKKSKTLSSIYKPMDCYEETLSEMLHDITGINLEKDAITSPHLPRSICKSCEGPLILAYKFRSKAIKSQRIIERYCNYHIDNADHDRLTDLSMQQIKNELAEFVNMDEVLEEKCIDNKLDYDTVIKIEELEITSSECDMDDIEGNIEYLDESDLELECDDNIDTLNKHGVENILNLPESSANVTVDLTTFENMNTTTDLRANKNVPLPSKCRRYEHAVSNDIMKKKSMERSKKTEKTDDGCHICDICGNIYAKRGRMMEHRRRHESELRYSCELCHKGFHLREKLRKHMYSHSGGKPFKCSFCSRTFFYESVRKAHEAIHQGYKPFVCEECNKPFAYSHALKKHILIHSDIKLYHCSYCEKDFRLQHHMKQHEKTKLHKMAVRTREGNISAS